MQAASKRGKKTTRTLPDAKRLSSERWLHDIDQMTISSFFLSVVLLRFRVFFKQLQPYLTKVPFFAYKNSFH